MLPPGDVAARRVADRDIGMWEDRSSDSLTDDEKIYLAVRELEKATTVGQAIAAVVAPFCEDEGQATRLTRMLLLVLALDAGSPLRKRDSAGGAG